MLHTSSCSGVASAKAREQAKQPTKHAMTARIVFYERSGNTLKVGRSSGSAVLLHTQLCCDQFLMLLQHRKYYEACEQSQKLSTAVVAD